MNRPEKPAKRPHQITPIWRQEVDAKKLARALLQMAMHLDETGKTVHTKAKQEGGGDHER